MRHLERIQALMPDLEIRQAELNREGLVNDVVIINRQRVFRFPKSSWAQAMLHHEVKVLALARRYVDVRLPDFDLCEDDVVSYELIPGEALPRDDVLEQPASVQDTLAETLAGFLSQLHTIPRAAIDKAGIGPSDTVRTTDDWLQLYDEVRQELFPLLMSDGKAWVSRLFAPLVDDVTFLDCTPTLIHGDLAAYHILCEGSPLRITGIVDFGTAGLGDPATDLGCLINVYGETLLRRMAITYPGIEKHIERARFWAGTLELQWLLAGIRSEDVSWFAVHIGRARDVNPVGSGWPI